MNDYSELANELERNDRLLMRDAAAAIRAQAARIAELEAEVERLLRVHNGLDGEIERLEDMMNCDLPGGEA